MKEPFDIIRTVRLTEKATLLTEKGNKYVFEVNPAANKSSGPLRIFSRKKSSRLTPPTMPARKSANVVLTSDADPIGRKPSSR